MIRNSVVALFLLSASFLSAQNHSSGSASPETTSALEQPSKTVVQLRVNSVCPIGMHARQGVWDHTITVDGGREQHRGPFGQRIVLTLTDDRSAKIVAATVLVRGFDGKNHMLQTGTADGNSTRILRTGFAEPSNNAVSADLYIFGFTAVSSLKLLDVTYSGGSTWHSDRSNPCLVAPDPLMLVATH